MKTHHLANAILALVLLAAVIGMYYIFKGPGMATQEPPLEIDVLAECCCTNHAGVPFMKPSMKTLSLTYESDCTAVCQEHGAQTCK
jgi:hypothetical protein